jgi:general secretion pathway protein G
MRTTIMRTTNIRATRIKKSQAGFTLIEIMVVIVILAVLATLVLPKIMDRPDEARKVKVMQDIRILEGALKLYRLDNFVYPADLEALVTKPEGANNWKGYLDRVPEDPWGTPYVYRNTDGKIEIISFGADGTEGGEGANSDISNKDLK